MAKKAVVVAPAAAEGETPSPKDTKLSNGLGLEGFIPKPAKKEAVKIDPDLDAEEAEADTKPDAKDEKKETPPKDKKTGRFLPKPKSESEPPIEDATEHDDSETLKKRLKDTRDWATRVNKQNQELDTLVKNLKREHEILSQKVAGTYVEPEVNTPDPVEVAKLHERTKISRAIAEELYGPELIEQLIFAEGSPYRELEQADPLVKARVFGADKPVIEAMRQLKWKQFTNQYGDDPDEIVEKLRAEVKAEFVAKLKEKGRDKRTIEDVGGLSDQGGSGREQDHTDPNTPKSSIDLKHIFGGFPTGHF